MFPFLPLLFNFAKNHIGEMAFGVGIVLLFVYIGVLKIEKNHWKSAAEKWELAYNTQTKLLEDKNAALERQSEAITLKYKNSLTDILGVLTKEKELIDVQIKNDKALRDCLLSRNAVRLFNESKRDPNSKTTTSSERGDAKEANTPTTLTLQDLLLVSTTNDINHWACVKQVEAWQSFWNDYTQVIESLDVKK